MQIHWLCLGGLSEPLSSIIPLWKPNWTLGIYINLAKPLSRSAFTVVVMEDEHDIHDVPVKPESPIIMATPPESPSVMATMPEPVTTMIDIPDLRKTIHGHFGADFQCRPTANISTSG